MSELIEKIKIGKENFFELANASFTLRNKALSNIAETLEENKEKIISENLKDINEYSKEKGNNDTTLDPILKRLLLDDKKIDGLIQGINDLIKLEDPIGKVIFQKKLDKNILLKKVSTPIGLIGVIFESRPDALVQISTLMIKSGNIAILKGGKEARFTNKILFDLIYEAGLKENLPENFIIQAESREDINKILKLNNYIDLLIPRGSNEFVQYIMKNSDIPVMGHADGICHIYVSENADFKKAIDVIIDSKAQYPAVCNAVETVLVDKKIAKEFLPELKDALIKKGVEIFSVGKVYEIIGGNKASEEQYKTEYLDLKITIGIVENLAEAVKHINYYGSHHTDAIMTDDEREAKFFQSAVDSASVYHNISTRFADGFRYGFGAEVGVATGKIHSRGPVGLDGLTIYKYLLDGNYTKVEEYARGDKEFQFENI